MARKKSKRDALLLHVDQQVSGTTVAAAVRSMQPELSWTAARKLVANRHVQIDGNLCLDQGRRLKSGEVVKLHLDPLAKIPGASDIEIVFSDATLVIVNKPSGMTSVRHKEELHWSDKRKQFQPTLDELLPKAMEASLRPADPKHPKNRKHDSQKHDFQLRQPSRFAGQIFPVHRLDRETSGLMVFARTRDAEAALIEQFSNHSIERVYVAIARGDVADQTIESSLVRDRGDGLRGSEKVSDTGKSKGQRAVTHVRALKTIGELTMIECRLETGRTHQIRIHLAELGCPICGERNYLGPPGGRVWPDNSAAPRIALHATRLGLVHPQTKQQVAFDQPIPPDLQRWLDSLESGGPTLPAKRRRRSRN